MTPLQRTQTTSEPDHPAGSPSDQELVARLARKGDSALEELIGRYGARVRTYVGLMVQNPTWAEDLTQEVFLRVLQNADSYNPRYPFRVWLFSIARNLGVDLLRREGIRNRTADRLCEERRRNEARNDARQWGDSPPTPLEQLERREFAEQFEIAVARLPETFRSVFLLRHFEGLSYEDIAEVVGIPMKTVSTRLHRARSRLRHALADCL